MPRPAGIVAVLAALMFGAAAHAAGSETGRIVIEPQLGGQRIATRAPIPAEVVLETTDPKVQRVLRTRLENGVITLDDMELGAYTGVRRLRLLDGGVPIGTAGDQAGPSAAPLRRDGAALRGTVAVEQRMRLVRPERTRFGVGRSAEDPLPAFHSPVQFAWASVTGATAYRLHVVVRGRPGEPMREPINVTATSARVELAPTELGEHYQLSLEALRGQQRIGTLLIDGVEMRGSPYLFRVVPSSVPADAPQPPARPMASDVFGGSARLVLVPTLDGEPWDLPQQRWVQAGIHTEASSDSVDVRLTDGVAEIDGLTAGVYRADLGIAPVPGGSECRTHREHPAEVRLREGATVRYEVPFRCAMRLRRPTFLGKRASPSELAAPVTFEWTAVPRATRYTYEVEGSTPHGSRTFARGEGTGTTWTVDLGPSLLPRDSYRIHVTAHGRHGELGGLDGAYTFRIQGGTPQAGVGRVTLVPTYDGVPLERSGDQPIEVRLQRLGSEGHRTIDARLANGTIELPEMETGIYDVSFIVDETYPPAEPRDDTNILWASSEHPLALLRNGQTLRYEVPLHKAFEVVEPAVAAIGSTAPRGSAPEIPMVTSPVRIAWKPVRAAARYRVRLDVPMIDDEEPGERVSESAAPSWTAELRATPPDEYYMVIIEAYGTRAKVAETMFRFGVTGSKR